MYKRTSQYRPVKFRKFLNKRYAAFCSVGKIIKICTLSASYSLLLMPLKARTTTDSIFIPSAGYNIEEVTVSGSRSELTPEEMARIINIVSENDIESSPAGDLSGYLDYVPGIDIKTRGASDIQSDISIRGANFEQTLVLLNGIKISDPQTGHNTMNLPFDLSSVNKIEIIKGPAARIFGANASAGAINFILEPLYDNMLIAGVKGGMYGYTGTYGSVNTSYKNYRQNLSAGYFSTDGYSYNTDVNKKYVFYNSRLNIFRGTLCIQAGYADKEAGSQNFYSLNFPVQFEETRTKLASVSFITGNKFKMKPSVYFRRGHDRFELYREGRNYYNRAGNLWINALTGDTAASFYNGHNYHMNTTYGIENDVKYYSLLGITTLGLEYRYEGIYSNTMGMPTDTIKAPGEKSGFLYRKKERELGNIYIEQKLDIGKLHVNGGVMMMWSSDFNWNMYPGIDIRYNYNKKISQFINVNKAVRLPSFTELYYNTSTHTSDPFLQPEKTWSLETGIYYNFNFISGYTSFFYRNGYNLIDWVINKSSAETEAGSLKWESKNITESNTSGAELSVELDLEKLYGNEFIIKRFVIGYSYLTTNTSSGDYISAYILDYLKHKVNATLTAGWRNLNMNLTGTYIQRNGYTDQVTGSFIDFKPYFLLDAKVEYKQKYSDIFLEVTNLSDVLYYDYHNIELPGRWVKFGIQQKLVLK